MKTMIFATILSAGMNMAVYAAGTEGNTTTFPVNGISEINIRTISGLINIEKATTSYILVEQLPDNATHCDVTMAMDGNTLVLKALEKEGEHKDIKTGFRVQLPAGISINANAVSGDVKISNISAAVKAETVSGDIRLTGIMAPVDAETTSGDIKLADIAAPVKTKSTSGNIVFAKVSGSMLAENGSGNIKGGILTSGTSNAVVLNNASGDISVTFPKDAQLIVDADSTSGKIHNEFAGKTGTPVTVRTISGGIAISKWK